jgi:hypothetical protein
MPHAQRAHSYLEGRLRMFSRLTQHLKDVMKITQAIRVPALLQVTIIEVIQVQSLSNHRYPLLYQFLNAHLGCARTTPSASMPYSPDIYVGYGSGYPIPAQPGGFSIRLSSSNSEDKNDNNDISLAPFDTGIGALAGDSKLKVSGRKQI